MGFDPRAAVTEALRNGVGTQARPNGGPPHEGAGRPPAEPVVERPPTPRRSPAGGSGRRTAQPPVKVLGVRRGRRRVLDLNLGREARAVLETDSAGRTRSEVVLDAIEASYEQIVEAHGRARTGLFAAAGRPAERRRVDDPRKVVVTVSEAEAEILSEVLARTTLSLSAFVDEALRWVEG